MNNTQKYINFTFGKTLQVSVIINHETNTRKSSAHVITQNGFAINNEHVYKQIKKHRFQGGPLRELKYYCSHQTNLWAH